MIPVKKEVLTLRVNITLACTECGDRNYISTKTSVIIQNELNLKVLSTIK